MPANLWSSVGSRQQLNLVSRYPAQMLAWACPQTLGPPSGHANMLRIFPARRRPRMKEPASGKQSQLDDEIAFRMQVCSFAKIPEKKVKNQKNRSTTHSCDTPCYRLFLSRRCILNYLPRTAMASFRSSALKTAEPATRMSVPTDFSSSQF